MAPKNTGPVVMAKATLIHPLISALATALLLLSGPKHPIPVQLPRAAVPY